MTATVFRQSYMTQRPSLFTLISYCVIVFSFALMLANGWFTACDGFYEASACWLSHMKTINHSHYHCRSKSHSFQNPFFFLSYPRNPCFKILPRMGNTGHDSLSVSCCPLVLPDDCDLNPLNQWFPMYGWRRKHGSKRVKKWVAPRRSTANLGCIFSLLPLLVFVCLLCRYLRKE